MSPSKLEIQSQDLEIHPRHSGAPAEPPGANTLERALRDLQVHQIELEQQNEELRRVQLERDAALARYLDLYDLAPVGYCTLDAQGQILEANLTAATLLGVARSALAQQRMNRFIALADQAPYDQLRRRLLATGQPQACDLRLVDPRGAPFWAHLEARAVASEPGGGLLRVTFFDVTARKAAEAALAQAATVQSAIFNSVHFLSIGTDTAGIIQVFNIGAETMLGYPAADVVNRMTLCDLTDPREVQDRAIALSAELGLPVAPGFEALVGKASRGREDIYDLTWLRRDGGRLPLAMSVSALQNPHDGIIGYLLMGTDNTARQRVNAERALLTQAIEAKNIELECARGRADEANLAKSNFLSSMSHELRTPLNAILGFAQLIEAGPPEPTPGQSASIGQVLKAGWYLLDLVNEILDLAKIDAGRVSLEIGPVDLAGVLQDCSDLVSEQAAKRGLSLIFPTFTPPCHVNADPTRLKQVLVNLLSNAIKFNHPGGTVTVEASPGRPGRQRIRVRDTGPGLAPAQIAQLFQPFNRLGQKDHVVEGTGVGLVVAKRLVELMNGVIGVESAVDQGSTFWIELDTADRPASAGPADAVAKPGLQPVARVRTVLYVEDNPANLALVEGILALRPDLRMLSASNGLRGIALARAERPDVILMDIGLPGMSGLEALTILTADPATRHIPVVALSAHAMPKEIQLAMAAGFFSYIPKPVRLAEFLATLDAALQCGDRVP